MKLDKYYKEDWMVYDKKEAVVVHNPCLDKAQRKEFRPCNFWHVTHWFHYYPRIVCPFCRTVMPLEVRQYFSRLHKLMTKYNYPEPTGGPRFSKYEQAENL